MDAIDKTPARIQDDEAISRQAYNTQGVRGSSFNVFVTQAPLVQLFALGLFRQVSLSITAFG